MPTLNPILSQGVGFEQPVVEPSLASGVFQIASGVLNSVPRPSAPSQSTLDNNALKPFARRVSQLQSAGGQKALSVARRELSSFIAANPGLENEAVGIFETAGFTTSAPLMSHDDILVNNLNEWAQKEENQHLVLAAYDPDDEVRYRNLAVVYQQDVLRKSKIEDLRIRNEQLKLTNENIDAMSTQALEVMVPEWQVSSQSVAEGLLRVAQNDPQGTGGDYEAALQQALLARNHLEATARAEAVAAGIKSSDLEGRMADILRPIDSVVQFVEANRENTAAALTAVQNQESRKLTEMFKSAGINGSPEVIRIITNMMGAAAAADLIEPTQNIFGMIFQSKNPENNATIENQTQLQSDSTVSTNTKAAGRAIAEADIATADGQEAVFDLMRIFEAAGSTRSGPFAGDTLQNLYGPALDTLKQVVPKNSDIRDSYGKFAFNQINLNRRVVEQAAQSIPGLSVSMNEAGQVVGVVDRTVLTETIRKAPRGSSYQNNQRLRLIAQMNSMTDEEIISELSKTKSVDGGALSSYAKAISNINTILRNTNEIDSTVYDTLQGELDVYYAPNDDQTQGNAGGDTLGFSGGDTLGFSGGDIATSIIMREEGFRTNAYWDVNAWRTGYGSDTVTKEDGSVVRVTEDTVITREDAARDLARRAPEFAATAAKQVGQAVWNSLAPNVTGALTSVAYNYGSLPSSVVKAVKTGDTEAIAAAVASLPANPERRKREAAIIRGENVPVGVAIGEAKAPVDETITEYETVEVATTASEQPRAATESQRREALEVSEGGGTREGSEAAVRAAQQEYSALARETQEFLIRLFGSEEAAIQSIVEKTSV